MIFFFFADLSADGADHPVLLPHADIYDLQLLAVWSCGVRPHCWVCLFLYRCYVQPFSIGSRKLEYFTNKACLGHLCRKKFHFYFWSFQRYCKTIFSIQNTHVWNVELLITCAIHWSTLMGVIFVTQILVKCTSIIVCIHFFLKRSWTMSHQVAILPFFMMRLKKNREGTLIMSLFFAGTWAVVW